jgi:hypothetical protein
MLLYGTYLRPVHCGTLIRTLRIVGPYSPLSVSSAVHREQPRGAFDRAFATI